MTKGNKSEKQKKDKKVKIENQYCSLEMEDLKESSDVLLIMFSGNLFQSVIVLGNKDSFLYHQFYKMVFRTI
jgi:hypothetical protein